MRNLVVSVVLLSAVLAVGETGARAESGSRRIAVGALGVMFASYPGSFEDPGPAVLVASPMWLGVRHRHFQWALDASALVGFGTDSKHVHLVAGSLFGFNLYLGSTLGFELRFGPAGVLQAGRETVAGLAFAGNGAWAFRLWDDDRRRLKLALAMYAGGYFADDPGNDLGTNAMGMGVGLAYETPF